MLVMAEICFTVEVTTVLAYDFTWFDAPAQVHEVDQTNVPLVSEVTVVHCEPDVAVASFHRS